MRRFESTPFLRLQMPGARRLDAWVAESLAARLLGLAFAPRLPDGRALLLPRCGSVHTVAMRFRIDIAFLTWPPAPDCEIVAVAVDVPPLRIVAPRGLPRSRVAALEASALPGLGVAPGARLSVESDLELVSAQPGGGTRTSHP
jgi:uncharacterized membrane protein (UPF0127 family)